MIQEEVVCPFLIRVQGEDVGSVGIVPNCSPDGLTLCAAKCRSSASWWRKRLGKGQSQGTKSVKPPPPWNSLLSDDMPVRPIRVAKERLRLEHRLPHPKGEDANR